MNRFWQVILPWAIESGSFGVSEVWPGEAVWGWELNV